jgi:hypothetical protein
MILQVKEMATELEVERETKIEIPLLVSEEIRRRFPEKDINKFVEEVIREKLRKLF